MFIVVLTCYIHRHAAINDIVHRSLTSAKIPARLEPSGLYRSDGKHPDGISVVPWKSGKLLVWDATCSDTFAPSYSSRTTNEAGAVATQAEERKEAKYSHLNSAHAFTTNFLIQRLSVAVQRGNSASVLGTMDL